MRKDYTITIKSPDDAAAKEEQTPVRPSERTPYRARRNGGYVYFYDLGQLNLGTLDEPIWVTNPWTQRAIITPRTDGQAPQIDKVSAFTSVDLKQFQDTLFEIPLAEWRRKFRRLTYDEAFKYGVDVLMSNGIDETEDERLPLSKAGQRGIMKWNPQNPDRTFTRDEVTEEDAKYWHVNGFLPSRKNNFTVPAYSGAFMGWTGGRVTETLDDFTTFETSFEPTSGGGHVYLMPQFYFILTSQQHPERLSDGLLGFVYALASRELWLNNTVLEVNNKSGDPFNDLVYYLFTILAPGYRFTPAQSVFAEAPTRHTQINDWVKSLQFLQYYNEDTGATGLLPPGAKLDVNGYADHMTREAFNQNTFPFASSGGVKFGTEWVLTMVVNTGGKWLYFYTNGAELSQPGRMGHLHIRDEEIK